MLCSGRLPKTCIRADEGTDNIAVTMTDIVTDATRVLQGDSPGLGVSEGFSKEATPETRLPEKELRGAEREAVCQAKQQQVEDLEVRSHGAFSPNMPGRARSQGRQVEARWQSIFLWHLGPILKASGSLRKSKARVTQSCLCEQHTLTTLSLSAL